MDNIQFQETVKSIEKSIKKANRSKESALKVLQKAGILNKSGNLTKAYRAS